MLGSPLAQTPFPHSVPHGGAAFLISELQPLAGWVRLGAALLILRASNQVSTGVESGWHPHLRGSPPPSSRSAPPHSPYQGPLGGAQLCGSNLTDSSVALTPQ